MWPELSRSNACEMMIHPSTEIERQTLDIFPKGYARFSRDPETIRHLRMLDFILIGEGSMSGFNGDINRVT
jgi:hypothetical protein